ncbi:heat-inducible transcriptional repressor HrcA [Clostridium felsineum]|uniref:heat-inducible transcriptional repressor HrcA n=1 Tax=Clostridium felsineum TaxID=36839 RepID=UPI00098C90F4|nr:heat-inducible transcriptional repressor HrcA [Clostridium felsineum]URZ01158.1 Heat-inducible transcription repressor HrcA [Clostridium felsineum]
MEMEERKLKILQAIINDYINNGDPVGSRTIAKKYDLGISSATIRNEMADLEEMGYIEQLHTSSGRKPSDKGYRLYVDKLMEVPSMSIEEEMLIKAKILDSALYEIDKIVKQAMSLVSEMTKLTCVVKSLSAKKSCIKSINLINIDSNMILCVFITDSGMIKNSVIRVKSIIENSTLERITNILNSRLKGLTIEQINLEVISNIKKDLQEYDHIFDCIIPNLYDILKEADSTEVYKEGTMNIFNYPEFKDIEKAKEFLSVIDDRRILDNLFNPSYGITVNIGNENNIEEAKEFSIVSSVYKYNGRPLGTIGIIGPTRIPYSKVIKVIMEVVDQINNNLNKMNNSE